MAGIARTSGIRAKALDLLGFETPKPGRSGTHSAARRLRLPPAAVFAVIVISLIPALLGLIGVDLGSRAASYPSQWIDMDGVHRFLAGSFTHTLLEWSAVAAALVTTLLALLYSRMHRDAASGVIGLALFCAATIDGYHILAAIRLIGGAAESERLIPFTWALSRSFSAVVLIVGIGTLLVRRKSKWQGRIGPVLWLGSALGALACASMYVATTSPTLPETIFPEAIVRRPWDVVPLLLFVFGAIVVFRPFHRRVPSLFSHAVLVSVVPQIAAQLHMAFGSQSLFDHDFNGAHFLKVVAYLVPMVGLLLDYVRTYQDEAVARVRYEREATQLGQYKLLEKIGEGGMGFVYKAKHAMLRRPTAIKLLPPDRAGEQLLQRFEREVQLTSELTHPNTISIYDYGLSSSGVFYYVMEYLDGIDLERLVSAYGAQPPGRAAHILSEICGALAEAHERGLVHRDIKPPNIILCQRGNVPDVPKVLDFGLVTETEASDGALTEANAILGTPAYMSPEAIAAPNKVGPASDIYGLGAVGYYLVTGQSVFAGPTHLVVCSHHLHTDPVAPSVKLGRELPTALDELLLRCLSKDPADRPTALELREELIPIRKACTWTEGDAIDWWRAHAANCAGGAPYTSDEGSSPTLLVDLHKRTLSSSG